MVGRDRLLIRKPRSSVDCQSRAETIDVDKLTNNPSTMKTQRQPFSPPAVPIAFNPRASKPINTVSLLFHKRQKQASKQPTSKSARKRSASIKEPDPKSQLATCIHARQIKHLNPQKLLIHHKQHPERKTHNTGQQPALRKPKNRSYSHKTSIIPHEPKAHGHNTPSNRQKRKPDAWGHFFEDQVTRQFA